MIKIEINESFKDRDEVKSLQDLKEVKGVVVYCRSDFFKYNNDTYTETAMSIAIEHELYSEKGYHYIIDAENIIECVPDNKQTQHLSDEGKATFINRALYGSKANENSIGILMTAPKNEMYEKIERKTIKFIADYLIKKDLTPDSVMRGFDLNKEASPLHLLEKEKWRKFIALLEKVYEAMKKDKDKDNNEDSEDDKNEEDNKDEESSDDKYNDDILEKSPTTYNNKDFREFYNKNGQKADEYAKNHEPDHRDIESIVNFQSNDAGEIKNFVTKNNTNFAYSVVENSPSSSDHCSRAFDTLAGKATPNQLEVEPIYPDLAVPPGSTVTLLNSATKDKPTQSNKVPLTIEDFENREQGFNIKNHTDAIKKIEGKPINNNDPYPIDDKIKELQSHTPKIKIDEVGFKLHDCNHPQSVIGPEVAKNFAMVQDEIITLAKRTERRLVKLENILSTVMRNAFRTAARMQINCVYYGGQDIYGKYKCIRCLHNDRINDGQSMTLDQCLSCTRYEPVLGQVYAILDETGTNVAQVLDDIQMSYMSMNEYINFTRTEELHTERNLADVSHESSEPKLFKDIYEEGFKMDWNPTLLENQRPDIAEYKTEGINAVKHEVEYDNQPTIEDEFKDTISQNEEYETIKYNSDDYTFDGFGDSSGLISINSSGIFGTGMAAEIRNKIVEYAQNALKLCQEGKAGYSLTERDNHLENAINGISYWDCSSLAAAAYKSAGINSVTGNTYSEFPVCKSSAGGILIPAAEEDKALPGDLVWFTSQNPKPTTVEDITNVAVDSIYHVGIYIGNGEYIHASTNEVPLTQQIAKTLTKYSGDIFAFGRPKELVEADKKAIEASAQQSFDPDAQRLPSDLRDEMKARAQGWANGVITNNQKWNYAPIFASVCKEKSSEHGVEIDPYMMMALSGVESGGDPYAGGPDPGLMQLSPGSGGASMPSHIRPGSQEATDFFAKQIRGSIDHLMGKRRDIMAICGEEWGTWPITIYGYNSGQGTVTETIKAYGLSPMTGGEFAPWIKKFVAEHPKAVISYPQVRYEYFARILWTYQILIKSI